MVGDTLTGRVSRTLSDGTPLKVPLTELCELEARGFSALATVGAVLVVAGLVLAVAYLAVCETEEENPLTPVRC